MNFFRRFFGSDRDENDFWSSRFPDDDRDFSEPFTREEGFSGRGFDMFSDPLQMHQYFEQEINDLLKSFGFSGFFGEFQSPLGMDDDSLKSNQSIESSETLRKQFLKPGYEKPGTSNRDKVDSDLDDRVKGGNLDVLIDDSTKITPYQNKPSTFFYGKSQSLRTITHPDGSLETQQSIKDNEGNEEITTCRIFGEKQYCVIKKRDKTGKEQVTEKLINMDEKEKDLLLKREPSKGPTDFPFDKFFG